LFIQGFYHEEKALYLIKGFPATIEMIMPLLSAFAVLWRTTESSVLRAWFLALPLTIQQ
jgi:hypothetical protein